MNNNKDIPIIPSKDMLIGDPQAPVTLVEFGDYESKTNLQAHRVVLELLEKYPDKINFNFRHYPLLQIHQRAHKAAEAAIAAGQEGKFAEMHELLLNNRTNLGVISLTSYARQIGIKSKQFLDSLVGGRYGWQVHGDLAEGKRLGIKHIPAFFISDKQLDGEITFNNFSKHILSVTNNKKLIDNYYTVGIG
ncbi:Thioredoxin [Chitinophaga sp. CF118]|uniref:DsbA family protein n=1 Tax=Chitinophaga sp. CF118 TaxID=1884367 RepID=UPI0008EF0A86|nr:thioredoxin domain-containing protein [Chitinophaga sp. CF118]SFF01560.1 Thioredoxin [Chitinophaga sp. CF118]